MSISKSNCEKFYEKLGIELPSNDPTLPRKNYFKLLGLNETDRDSTISANVKQAYDKQSKLVREFRNLDQYESGNIAPVLDKAKNALNTATGIHKHKDELKDLRTKELRKEANRLHQNNKVRENAKETLAHVTNMLGYPDAQVEDIVNQVLDETGPWTVTSKPLTGRSTYHKKILLFVFCGIVFAVIFADIFWVGENRVALLNIHFPEQAPISLAMAKPEFVSVATKHFSENNSQNSPYLAFDTDESSQWVSASDGNERWFEVDFGRTVPIDGIALVSSAQAGAKSIKKARLEFDSGASEDMLFEAGSGWQVRTFDVRKTSKIRLLVLSTYEENDTHTQVAINEIWFYQAEAVEHNINLAGTWETSWGEMRLEQKGNWVFGSFNNAAKTKIIAKNMREKNLFVGTWSAQPTRTPPNNAGDIHIRINSNEQQLKARFRYGAAGTWDDDWSGNRKKAR